VNQSLQYPLFYVLNVRKHLVFGAGRVIVEVFTEPCDLENLEVRRTDEDGIDEYGGVFADSSGAPVRLEFDFRNYRDPIVLRTGTGTVPEHFLRYLENEGHIDSENASS